MGGFETYLACSVNSFIIMRILGGGTEYKRLLAIRWTRLGQQFPERYIMKQTRYDREYITAVKLKQVYQTNPSILSSSQSISQHTPTPIKQAPRSVVQPLMQEPDHYLPHRLQPQPQ